MFFFEVLSLHRDGEIRKEEEEEERLVIKEMFFSSFSLSFLPLNFGFLMILFSSFRRLRNTRVLKASETALRLSR